MNIEARKISIAQTLFNIQKKDVLDKIEAFIRKEIKEAPAYRPDGTPLTLEEYNRELEEGLDDVKNGRTFTSEELTKRIESWAK